MNLSPSSKTDKTVFFDLGNVLLFFDYQKMYQQMGQFCGLHPEELQPLLLDHSDSYERGSISSREIHTKLCERTNKSLDFHGLMEAMSDIFQLNEGMVAVIKELKAKKVPLFLLSNTCEAHFDFAYTHYPILHHFDGFVLSYEVGARKPEKKIFEKALEIAQCSQASCFYTDDIPEYIAAARQYSIDAEVFTNPTQLQQQLHARGIL